MLYGIDLPKILIILVVFLGLAVLAVLLARAFRTGSRIRKGGSMIKILEVAQLDVQRNLVLFSCPFAQGLVLLSPKGDQVVIFNRHEEDYEPLSKQ